MKNLPRLALFSLGLFTGAFALGLAYDRELNGAVPFNAQGGPTYPPGSRNPFDYPLFPEELLPRGLVDLEDILTLRDLFAAAALPAVIARNTDPALAPEALSDFLRQLRESGHPVPVQTGAHAYDAYTIADSMLNVRYSFPVIGVLPTSR